MKTILLGLLSLGVAIASPLLIQDATATLFFAPIGIYTIYLGISYGDQVLEDEFWERRERVERRMRERRKNKSA